MSFHYNNSNNFSNDFNNKVIMFSAIFSLSFVIVVVVLLYIYARRAFRLPPRRPGTTLVITHVDRVPPKTGLDPMVINSLPSFLFKQLDGQDREECSVCLSILEDNEMARELPNCNHIFHIECIDTWLSGRSTCPVCRTEATPLLAPLDREPPRGGLHDKIDVVATSANDHQRVVNKEVMTSTNASGGSSSSSFRLSSFRKIIGRDRSFSSRRNQATAEYDLENQLLHQQ